MYDLLVKNGKIVTAEAVESGNIAIQNGKIAAILQVGEEPEAYCSEAYSVTCRQSRKGRA